MNQIKLTIGELSSPGLGMSLQKLTQAQVDTRTAYRYKKLFDEYDKTMRKIRDEYTKGVAEVYGQLDEKKKPILDNSVPWGFKLKEGVTQEDFDKANDEFHKKEIIINRPPLALSELTQVKISANEFNALGKFFLDPEEHGNEDALPPIHLAR